MFTTKYRPTMLKNFIGNNKVILTFTKWLLEWDSKNKKTKCALVSGINGIGKSLLTELLLFKYDCHVIHLDDKDKDKEKDYIKSLLKMTRTFDGQKTVLVISDIDSITDHGFIPWITECIKETEIPIICICDDRYNQHIKPILNYCYDIKMSKPTYDEVYPLIYNVVVKENIKISKSSVDKLYELSNGDIRFILNNLQMGIFHKKNNKNDVMKNTQSANIFETTGKLFMQSTELEDKYNIYWMSHDIHTLMIHENHIGNTLGSKIENTSYSADSLSDMDLFDTTFHNELLPYVAMNTIKATSKCSKKGQIKFTQFLGKNSIRNKNKREKVDYTSVKFKL
jgi:replication factor C subunit 1